MNGEKCEVHEDGNARQVKFKESTTSNNKSWVHRTFILENNIVKMVKGMDQINISFDIFDSMIARLPCSDI